MHAFLNVISDIVEYMDPIISVKIALGKASDATTYYYRPTFQFIPFPQEGWLLAI